MAGYTRQSVADIIANAVVKAAPINAEFNALRDAFASGTGHKHDNTTGQGGYIPLIADLDGKNRVTVDTANNRISVFTEVSGVSVEQIRIQDGAIVPVTDNDIDLGTSVLEFKNLYIDGTANIDTLVVDENATITGNLTVNGNTTLGNAGTDTVTVTAGVASDVLPITNGTYDLGSPSAKWQDLWIDGTASIDSLVADTADINAGTIDNTVIGATTPVAATVTTLNATSATTSGNLTVGSNLAVTGTSTFTGAVGAGSVTASGTATLATVDINAGAIDGTIIGASSSAAGSFTTVNTSGQATLASVNIDGGTIDGAVIGGASAAAITGTNITANTGFTGPLTGAVTGNVTGNLTGDVTGNVTGNLTGNVTAASGTSTFTDVTINGTLNMNAGTVGTITGLSTPVNTTDATTKTYVDSADALKLNLSGGAMSGAIAMGTNKITGLGTPTTSTDAATKGYVDTSVSALIDSAPGALDTLNELAAALGDDPNFATTVTTSIATKVSKAGDTMTGNLVMGTNKVTSTATPTTADDLTRKGYVDTQDDLKLSLTGGTMSGVIAMGTSKITGLGDPTLIQDAATKNYVDTQDATKLSLSGGTMTGAIDMGANKVTSTYTPTDNPDLTTKVYVDSILGSATSAANSAAAAATSESNAATSESNAANSASAAAASYDDFDDRYLGSKTSAPSVDNDGNTLLTGALYWNTTSNQLFVWDGAAWNQAAFTLGDALTAVVEDTTPQLGGNLDLNGSDITGTGNVNITGAVTTTSLVATTADINGGTIDGTVIGGSTPAAISGTTGSFSANVGIGTSNPATQAHVSSTSVSGLTLERNVSGAGASTTLQPIIFSGPDSGSANANHAYAKIDSITTSITNGSESAALRFFTSGSGTLAERLRITSTGNVLVDVNRSINFIDDASRIVGISSEHVSPNSDLNISARGIGGGWAGNIKFYTSNNSAALTERLRITSTGAVGIGTSSPTSPLHVNGGADPSINITGSSGTATIKSTDRDLKYDARFGTHVFVSNGTTERLRIDASGNVGIGTSSPLAKLHVVGDTIRFNDPSGNYFTGFSFDTAVPTGGSIISQLNSSGYLQLEAGSSTSSNSTIRFKTANTERARITSTGNVGIGTSSPAAKLSVSNSGAEGFEVSPALDIGGVVRQIAFNRSTSAYVPMRYQALEHQFWGSGSERLRIDASGNVGIGTSTPTERLHVIGNILASGNVTAFSDIRLKTDLQPIPDALAKVQSLTGYTYERTDTGERQTGVVAQEVQKVLPEAVSDNGEHMAVAYGNMVGLLIEAIKELTARVEELEAR